MPAPRIDEKQTLNMKKPLTYILVAVFALLGFAVYRVFSGPPRPEQLASLPPAEQQKRRAQAQQLVEQVEDVAKRVKARERGTFTLSSTGAQLNTLIQDRIRGQNLPIKDIGVGLQPGEIVVTGTAQKSGIELPVVLSGPLEAQGGALKFTAQTLTVGGFAAPGDWKEKAQLAIGSGLERAFRAGSGARFESVQIENDKITVSGRTG